MGLLDGKKALITGSRRGIGAGIAAAFAAQGADVGINDIERDSEAEKTIAGITEMGRKASWHLADISSAADRERMFDEFVAEHGRIDVLVNNAVSGENATFTEITEAMWDFQIGNALKGYVFCSQRAAREMIAQGSGGSIISISSVHSLRSWPEDAIYGIAKAGLNRMVLSMAQDLAGSGINSNCIAPGYIDSRVFDARRRTDPRTACRLRLAPDPQQARRSAERHRRGGHFSGLRPGQLRQRADDHGGRRSADRRDPGRGIVPTAPDPRRR